MTVEEMKSRMSIEELLAWGDYIAYEVDVREKARKEAKQRNGARGGNRRRVRPSGRR